MIMNLVMWVVIGALIVLALILLKFKEIRHRIGLFSLIVLGLFLVISVVYVANANKADLSSFDGLIKVGKVYFSWLVGVGKNIASISGYAIKQNWAINSTNVSIG